MEPGSDVLAPLRARYAHWLSLSADQVLADRANDEDDPAGVFALQLLLRLERTATPSRRRAIELAATGCVEICLDPRTAPGGQWHDAVATYCAKRIRKVIRRARGAQWETTAVLPGLSLTDGDSQIRVLVPGPVGALDKSVSKLQVGGTDLPDDLGGASERRPGALQLWVPTEPPMTAGKQMAQAGHAGMIAAALMGGDDQQGLLDWAAAGFPVSARSASPAEFAGLLDRVADPEKAWRDEGLLAVRDAGFTEIAPGTVTVIAKAPGR